MPSLHAIFLFLAVVGGALGLIQALGALFGLGTESTIDTHDPELGHHDLVHGAGADLGVFQFRSVRAVAAGIAFTGLGGLLAQRQFPDLLALVLALSLGAMVYLFVAFVMRGFSRLDADHSVHPLAAVGLGGVVSLPIPTRGGGPGKVTLVVGGRNVEWPAVQPDSAIADAAIPSGTEVLVVDAADDTTLTVVPVSPS